MSRGVPSSHTIFFAKTMINSAILLLFFFILSSTIVQGLSPDGQALLVFKSRIDDEFNRLGDWVGDSTPCAWTGVSCNSDDQVTALNLSSMNLSGIITPAPLPSLTNLSLDLNDFSSDLPVELFTNLPSLAFLNISHCNFSNDFPHNLSSARSIEVIDAYNNNFVGDLPVGVASLSKLRHLHLGGSFFSGSIPAEYGQMKNLKLLALSGNGLTGVLPHQLGNLQELQQLTLGYFNNFSGGIPKEFGNLKNLRLLDLAFCGINGSIPEELGDLKKLDSLFLQLNSLTGTIPESIGRLSGLKSLDLSCNQLSGEIPGSLEKLVQLELMSLFRNNLSGEIPSFVGDLPNLEVVYMWGNRLEGGIPAQLGGSKRLKKLDLSKNFLNGSIPEKLCDGGLLDTLILQQNSLTGSIPDSLGSCASLEKVRLGDNLLVGQVPKGFFSLPGLHMLELMRNKLDGMFEDAVFDPSSSLEIIDLSENRLRGEVPDGIGNLFSLRILQVSWNRLSGAVPETLEKLQWLLQLNMSHNLFTGGIPSKIGSCKELTMLDLSINQLSGEIPQSLCDLHVLSVLNLSKNSFSGGIPPLKGLTSVDFSFNKLSGQIPAAQAFNKSSYIGNLGLCGFPLGPCPKSPVSDDQLRHRTKHSDAGLLAWLVGALFSAALLVLVVGICCFFKKYRYYICGFIRRNTFGQKHKKAWKLTTFQRLDLSASQILECMNDDNIIGRGGSGTVYKGVLPSGEAVAVKKLSAFSACARKGGGSNLHSDHGFSAEVQTLGKIRHRNIVRLLGFCCNHETNVLVYEYMVNGSLGEALHGKKAALLDWGTRYKIALQAANGLCYLHHDCSPLIVHRDVKSNNILLDEGFQAHVADFGLAKLFQDSGKSESMSSIAGSYGYIAPEYAYTLKVNEKSDIYSFGVVLLELVTGRRPIEAEYGDGVDIVQWVRKKIQSKDGVLELLDSRIGDENLPVQEIMLVLRVALLCTSDLPVDRPTMRDVVQMLGDAKPSAGKGKESSDLGDLRSELLPNVC